MFFKPKNVVCGEKKKAFIIFIVNDIHIFPVAEHPPVPEVPLGAQTLLTIDLIPLSTCSTHFSPLPDIFKAKYPLTQDSDT